MLPFLSFYVIDKTLCICHRSDVFISDNNICYDYGDFSASILLSTLKKTFILSRYKPCLAIMLA